MLSYIHKEKVNKWEVFYGKVCVLFSEGNASMRDLLGGKGANLAEMTSLGLPVPRGFTITTEACTRYYQDGKVIAKEIEDEIYRTMEKLEEIVGKKFVTHQIRFLFPFVPVPEYQCPV